MQDLILTYNTLKMNEYISKERKRIEKELILYLRKYRFYSMRFKNINELDQIINDIVNELKTFKI